MNKVNLISAASARLRRLGVRVLAAWLLLVLAGTATLLLPSAGPAPADSAPASLAVPGAGWGGEAIGALSQQIQQLSPVPLANACGLGASSCFRCHNGKRAASPTVGDEAGLWHQQHAKVNYSCAGCHQGNPRILKQEIAHKGLIANPVADPAKSCTGCHAASEVDSLATHYHSFLSAKTTGN